MKLEIKKITPSAAKKMLLKNNNNRVINKSQLEMIKRTMLDGKWRLTHQGIAIYKNGNIADGQHRLTAIAETGVSCMMPIFKDLDNDIETVLAIDCGRSRTVADGAAITGDKIKTSDNSLAKGFEFGYSNKFPKLTHSESYDLIIKHHDKIEAVSRLFKKSCRGVSIANVKVAIGDVWQENQHREADIKSFCRTLATGEYDSKIMINAVKLRNKLLSDRYTCGGLRNKAYLLTVSTLRKTLEGKKVERLVE